MADNHNGIDHTDEHEEEHSHDVVLPFSLAVAAVVTGIFIIFLGIVMYAWYRKSISRLVLDMEEASKRLIRVREMTTTMSKRRRLSLASTRDERDLKSRRQSVASAETVDDDDDDDEYDDEDDDDDDDDLLFWSRKKRKRKPKKKRAKYDRRWSRLSVQDTLSDADLDESVHEWMQPSLVSTSQRSRTWDMASGINLSRSMFSKLRASNPNVGVVPSSTSAAAAETGAAAKPTKKIRFFES